MFKPKTILVPTDLSDASKAALMQAAELAAQFGSKVIVLTVTQKDVDFMPLFFLDDKKMEELKHHLEESTRRDLEQIINECLENAAAECETRVRNGVAYDEILKEADESEVDLIVISSKGKSALEGFFYGSTTEKVVRRATCSVLVVRPKPGD